jgi:hypothetical protein
VLTRREFYRRLYGLPIAPSQHRARWRSTGHTAADAGARDGGRGARVKLRIVDEGKQQDLGTK